MNYRYYLISFIVCLLTTVPVLAQDTRYRVEILVLTHLDHNQEPKQMKHLADFSPATDFLTPPEEETEEETAEKEIAGQEIVEEANQAEELLEEPDPNALVHIEEMSDVMREAWRRMRLSAPFRPEQYLSWEQGREEPFPALRMHDLDVVMVDDPYAELRRERLEQALEEADDEEQATVFTDAAGVDVLSGTEEPELPQPTQYYRLDGAVTLKRTRFLHLELDLQLREAVWEDGIPVVPEGNETEIEQILPSAFLVHDLQQSRQVKTRRMEYFDGPVLSVLAYITAVKVDPP